MVSQNEYFLKPWIAGLSAYIAQLPGKRESVKTFLGFIAGGNFFPSAFPMSQVSNFTDAVMNGAMVKTILEGTGKFRQSGIWEMLPGIPHTRGLKGCEFLTSYEMILVLGLDVCSVGVHSSVRPLCPRSCHCGPGMSECPYVCVAAAVPKATTVAQAR